MRLPTLLCLAGLLVASPGAAERLPAPPPTLDEAIAQAKQAGKPLLLEFSTVWCTPCRDFDEKILPDPGVQRALQDTVFVHYDAEDGPGIEAARRFRVDRFPTFIVVDGQGQERARTSGVDPTPDRFVAFVEKGVALALDEAAVKQRVAAAPKDPQALILAARWYAGRGRNAEALEHFDRAIAADRQNRQGVAAAATWEAGELRRFARLRRDTVAEAADYVKKYPAAQHAAEALALAALSGELKPKQVKALCAARLKAIQDDPALLNGFVYVALGAGAHDEALAAAKRQVALRPDDANPYDTLAEAHHYRGERAAALAASDEAMKRAGGDGMRGAYAANRQRFERAGREPSPDVERARERVRGELARLEPPAAGGGDRGGGKTPGDPPPDPGADAFRAFLGAVQRAVALAQGRCGADAAGLPEVYVRLELAAGGGKPTRVAVLEPDASPRLTRCLVDALAAESYPSAPEMFKGRYTTSVTFQPLIEMPKLPHPEKKK